MTKSMTWNTAKKPAEGSELLLLSPLSHCSLKKRKHFLTVGWKDEQDKQHAAVFEVGKGIVRTTIVTLEARTGRRVEYEDDEVRKSGMGGML